MGSMCFTWGSHFGCFRATVIIRCHCGAVSGSPGIMAKARHPGIPARESPDISGKAYRETDEPPSWRRRDSPPHRRESSPSSRLPSIPRVSSGNVAFGSRVNPNTRTRVAFANASTSSSEPSGKRSPKEPKGKGISSDSSSTVRFSLHRTSNTQSTPSWTLDTPSAPSSRVTSERTSLNVHHRRDSLPPVSERVSIDGEFISPTPEIRLAESEAAMERLRSFSVQEEQRSRDFHSEFDPTPIQRLRDEYEKQDESLEDATESTLQGATLLGFKSTLEQEDIVDRGDARERGQGRFGLEERLYARTDRIVGELQFFLQRAARLSPARERYFHVDPEDAITPLLQGSSDIPQLRAAWEILRSRIVLGMRFFDKYEAEVYDDAAGRTPPRSPASTAREVEEGLRALETSDQKLRHMVAYYPHHHNPTLRHDQRLRILSRDWGSLLSQSHEYAEEQPPSPAKSLTHHLEEEALQEKEVPHDQSAVDAVSYSFQDERQDVRQGKLRMAPEPSGDDVTFVTAEGAASEGRTSLFGAGPLPTIQGAGPSQKTYPSPWKAPSVLRDPAYSAAILGPNTPYKSASSFFANLSKQSGLSATVREPLKSDPNILYRLGAGPASSVSQTFREKFRATPPAGDETERAETGAAPLRSRPSNPFETRSFSASSTPRPIPFTSVTGGTERTYVAPGYRRDHNEETPQPSGTGSKGSGGWDPPPPVLPKGGAPGPSQGSGNAPPGGGPSHVPPAGGGGPPGGGGGGPPGGSSGGPPGGGGSGPPGGGPGPPGPPHPGGGGFGRGPPGPIGPPGPQGPAGNPGPPGPPGPPGGGGAPVPDPDAPVAPYGTNIPTIEAKLKLADLPTWDGNHDTAIQYFWDVSQKAALQGYIPAALGYWLGMRLEQGSPVQICLAAALKALGYTPERSRYTPKQAHLNTRDEAPYVGRMSDEEPGTEEDETNDDLVLKQVYATLKDRRRPPPPGGYPFPKNDSVVTKLARLPPGPCRLCGSEKHWNRECPNYMLYNEGTKRNAKIATTEPTEEELMYQNAFSVLLNQALSSASVDFGKIEGSGFESASPLAEAGEYKTAGPNGSHKLSFPETGHLEHVPRITNNRHGNSQQDIFANSGFNLPQGTRRPAVTMEEIEDEDELAHARKPKSNSSLLESVDEEEEEPDTVLESPSTRWRSRDRARQAACFSKMAEEFWINDGRLFPEDNEMEEVEPEDVESDDEWEEESRRYSEAREAHTTRRESPERKVEFDFNSESDPRADTKGTGQSNSKAKLHRARQSRKRRAARKFGEERSLIRASRDYRFRPHESRSILVEGYFEDDREWLVEKGLLANGGHSYFAARLLDPLRTPRYSLTSQGRKTNALNS
ncbi:hypothetical protein B0H11DRAFT_1943358 [Mycena galericulata]|nr:hypothetical protein B0H11DRAFT_1943358 [Mycena galericulata]